MKTDRQYHIQCSNGDVGRYCILTGDPGRVEKIAGFLDSAQLVAQNREFTTFTGTLSGECVSVASTGIGGPSAAIAMEELAAVGADTFIRVGTCGGIDMSVISGDCVIPTGAVRMEGTSREYAPIEFPAVADFAIVSALVNAGHGLGFSLHTGVVQCKDSFYGQHSPERMPVSFELLAKWEAWRKLHVLGSEMESAALFTVAAALGVRCGTVLHVLWNQERKAAGLSEKDCMDPSPTIRIAVEAIRLLIETDRT